MDYIKYLREMIGHKPVNLVGSGCLIFNEKGQVLLQRRSEDGLWGNVGGLMELGETIYENVIREVKEETNLDIRQEDLKLFNIYSGEGQHYFYPNGDEVHLVNIMFETHKVSGKMKLDHESLELKYFDLDKLPTDTVKAFKEVKADLEKRL